MEEELKPKKLLARIERKVLVVGGDKYKSHGVSFPKEWLPKNCKVIRLSLYDNNSFLAEFKEDKDSILFKPQE